jgi:hypothetical protein
MIEGDWCWTKRIGAFANRTLPDVRDHRCAGGKTVMEVVPVHEVAGVVERTGRRQGD